MFVRIPNVAGPVEWLNVGHITNVYYLPAAHTDSPEDALEIWLTHPLADSLLDRSLRVEGNEAVAAVLAQLDALTVRPAVRDLVPAR